MGIPHGDGMHDPNLWEAALAFIVAILTAIGTAFTMATGNARRMGNILARLTDQDARMDRIEAKLDRVIERR